MSFYDEMADIAAEVMDEFKQGVVTLTQSTPGEVDPEHPERPVDPTTEKYLLKAVVKAIEDKYVDGTTIFATDNMVTLSPVMTHTHTNGSAIANAETSIEIDPGDHISIDGKGVTIVKVMRTPKAGTAVVWKIITKG